MQKNFFIKVMLYNIKILILHVFFMVLDLRLKKIARRDDE